MNKLAVKPLSQCSRNVGLHRGFLASTAFRRYNSSKPLDHQSRSLQNLEAIADLTKDSKYPDLMEKDHILDDFKTLVFEPTNKTPYQNKVIIRNDESIFDPRSQAAKIKPQLTESFDEELYRMEGFEGEKPEVTEEFLEEGMENFEEAEEQQSHVDEQEMHHERKLDLLTDLSSSERGQLFQFPLIRRIVKHQTGKGKVARYSVLTVIGNGKGLVGYGEAKDFETAAAFSKSLVQAFKNVDHVERFEQRTVWTEMSTKLGSTRLVIRPRPVGFGLRCNPYVHQVLKAAGIKDASVKVWGSRNPGNVVKALFRMLHAGNAPLGMGNGVGGGSKKLEKGVGMRSAFDIERDRGRRMVNLVK
jgi:small subunit ribosomal protein S5